MTTLNWLHLSDWHQHGNAFGREVVRDALLEDLRARAAIDDSLARIDFVVFSGDLAYYGKAEEYQAAWRDLLEPVLEAVGLRPEPDAPAERLVIVPGNHDLDRGVVEDLVSPKLQQPLTASDEVEHWLTDSKRRRNALQPFEAFRDFVCEHTGVAAPDYGFVREFTIEGIPIAILGLNSAWMCGRYREADGAVNDYGRLVLGEPQFHDGLTRLAMATVRLAVVHHPFDWLAEFDRNRVESRLLGGCHFLLRGHTHKPQVTAGVSTAGSAITLSAGASYDRRTPTDPRYANAYNLVALDLERGTGTAFLRRWSDPRTKWIADTDTCAEGRFRFELPPDLRARSAGGENASRPSAAALRHYLERVHAETGSIDIQGFGTRHGRGRTALRYPIEELYTPLRARVPPTPHPLKGGRGSAEEAEREGVVLEASRDATFPLSDLLSRHRLLLIEGQPGAGKTTFVRLVAAMLARDGLGIPCPRGGTWARQHLGLDECPVPLFVRAALLVPRLEGHPGPDDRQALAQFVAELCCDGGERIPAGEWSARLERGGGFLLLDGLDEVASDVLRVRLLAMLRDAVRGWPNARLLITSRPIETEGVTALGFDSAVVEPFGPKEIRAFVERWVRGLHAGSDAATERQLADHQRTLEGAILHQPAIRRLAENPVMLTCLAVVHFNEGRLPDARARLYQAVLNWLLRAKSGRRQQAEYGEELARRAFARLAYGMMTDPRGKRSTVSFDEAARLVAPDFERELPHALHDTLYRTVERWLDFECEASGIVQELPGRQLRFWHLTFQEYFAALALSWRVASDALGGGGERWLDIVARHLEDSQWRETLDLLPGCLFDGPGAASVDALLADVVERYGRDETLPGQARLAALLSRSLLPLREFEYKAAPQVQVALDRALAASMAIFTVDGARAVPVRLRLEVAEALGRAKDPRFAADLDHFLPVPGQGVALGKYPVTVEAYRHFVDQRGYEQPRYWSTEGWVSRLEREWKAPADWEDQLEHPNRPVVGVSWHEAEAFARWRGEQTGFKIRLPSNEEWETSATSPKGEYPWGSAERSEELLDCAIFGFNHPSPVGLYPAGAGPAGHLDLAGNVWEWVSDGDEASRRRFLRGGSWIDLARNCRSAARCRFVPSVRYVYVGFRLAAVHPAP